MADTFKPLKGMIKDTGRMDQVDGSYRDALNLIIDDLKLNVANEYGTISVSGLNVFLLSSTGTVINVPIAVIGQIALLDDNFIVFGCGEYYDTTGLLVKVSAIFKIDVPKRIAIRLYYTTDVQTTSPGTVNPLGHLNFDSNHPVTAELRESPTQEEIVYFTDNKSTFTADPSTGIEYVSEYNPPRVFNVTKQEESVDITGDPTNLYGTFKRVEFLNLFMDSGRVPEFDDIVILKGGGVTTGAYYLGVGYADDDRTETNVLTVSNPVYIVPANDDSFPREMISGAPNGTQTDKSIQWRLNNVNTEYKYLVPYIIQYSGTAKFVYKLENVNITSPNVNVVYSGLEKVAASDIRKTVIDKVRFLTAKSITQLDNKLYAANLTSRPDLGFQRFANNIKVQPMVELVIPFDPRRYDIYTLNEGYSQLVYPDPVDAILDNPVYTDQNGTYLGPMGSMTSNLSYTMFKGVDGVSEAYVTSIIIPLQQGTSAGYRDPNLLFKKKGYRRGEVYAFYISFVLKDGSETYAYHIPGRDKVDAFEDDWTAFETGIGATLGALGFGIKTGEIRKYDPNARVYQYFDTSYIGPVPSISSMGYWNNLNEVYPTNENFEVWGVNSDGTSSQLSTLANTNIRHHKMPSNHNNAFSHVVRNTYFGDVPLSDPLYTSNADGYRVFNDQVRILGIQLENLKIPKFILKQVQGYKVYYAKRTQGNKTIIGQSGAHPSTSYLAANLSNTDKNAGQGPYFNIWSLDGDLKYGGLAIADTLWTQAPVDLVTSGFSNEIRNNTIPNNLPSPFPLPPQINYIGNPVFKFHDFNLLRKRPTLATATHIDIQYICLMESWRGGYKGAQRTQVPDAAESLTYIKYYRSFRSGIGEDTFSWVHEDLGNMINYSVPITDAINYDNPGPKVLWGNVYIASRYYEPGVSTDNDGFRIDQGITWYQKYNGTERYLGDINKFPNIAIGQSALLSNTQTILMIEPEGATYVNGLSILKSATANGFKGATYLYNAFGESSIAISLASGLPNLGGYKTNEWSYIGLSNLIWSLPIYSGIISNGSNATNTPGTSGPVFDLVAGHDINYNKGFDTPSANVWPVVENTFLQTLASGHSSLRQPYNMVSPPVGIAAVNLYYTGQPTGQGGSGAPSLGIGNNEVVIITGAATGGGSPLGNLSDIQVGATVSAFTVNASAPAFQNSPSGLISSATVTLVQVVSGYYIIRCSRDFVGGALMNSGVNIRFTQSADSTTIPVDNDPKTRPNTYLINLCSNKTDVFEPFDKQELVWTGFYKRLNVDIETGVDLDNGSNYYGTANSYSGPIFGGDTYICRYSYRTTSNLYGLGRFRKGMNAYNGQEAAAGNLGFYIRLNSPYIWGDVPLNMDTGTTPAYLNNIFNTVLDYQVLRWGGVPDNPLTSLIEGAGDESKGMRRNSILDKDNWSAMGYEVFTTIYQYMVESDDNINYRHAGDPEKGISELNSMYFDRYVAADVLYRSPLGDLTKMDNILYEDHYSALQDIRVPIAFPKETTVTIAYPNRVIRSNTQDGNFNDTYRYFLGIEYKDFAVNKGSITNIFNLKALLYIHTEKSLFRTKGKQNIELGDATQAYIGSGDLFAQEPDEFIQSIEGYNGLYNKMGSLVTKDGYIFVARKSRKIFLVKDSEIVDLTQLGINAWARENIPFALEAYGWDPDYLGVPTDAPTGDFGFLVSYDPLFKRTLITKRELIPTQALINAIDQGIIIYDRATGQFRNSVLSSLVYPVEEGSLFERGGWTISFSNNSSVWASRHSYIPALYAFNSKYMYSFNSILSLTTGLPASTMYEHSDFNNPGSFYGTVYNFEIDCIFTAPVNAIYSGFKYTADVFNKANARLAVEQQFSPGFTSFYVYNTTQISGEVDFVYLNNIRKTDNNWNVNAFRDLSRIVSNSGLAVGQINVQGVPYTNTSAPTSVEPMFLTEGIINLNYIDPNKPWYEQRKFVDKFLGIRLIANNLSKNLINLYTVTAALRVSPR
jgi:hypothetical protein